MRVFFRLFVDFHSFLRTGNGPAGGTISLPVSISFLYRLFDFLDNAYFIISFLDIP